MAAPIDISKLPPGYLQEYNGDSVNISLGIFITIFVFAIALRFWAKYLVKAKLGLDDWLMIPSGLAALAAATCCLLMVSIGGAGYHIIAVYLKDPNEIATFAKLTVAFATFYVLAMNLPKISMVCMFLRIFVEPWQRRACYILIAIMVCTTVGDMIADWTLCTPMAYLWDKTIPGGWCFDVNAFWRWGSFPNIITDLAMILLPIPTIIKVQLSWKDKLGLLATFLIGGGGLATSILRFHTYYTIDGAGPNADGTYEATPGAIFSILEVTVYILCACLPSYRSFYLYVRRGTGRTANVSKMYGGSSKPVWRKQSPDTDTQIDDYQTPFHKGFGNQTHSTFVPLDDMSETSANAAGGISVRSEYKVTATSR